MTIREAMERYIEAKELLEGLLQTAADPSLLRKTRLTETELAEQFNNVRSQFEDAEKCLAKLGLRCDQ
ncbi:hypothetical protein [Leadbettera azotonutricia]|uniref:Uncharacterized protein n=1 Tax=Leadbettera azotonutricia (strain ATCC BAA-888 / DSM 13862 / ZAS-9) TaxID=545695 RepID=F5YFN5_LEAAZ|nr:hypothetical protein [Leadbettera azotonutricia]AEF83364.1 hypothetical protein TREAZ_2485 [Leadbettera azotonutricia ZAS-9]